MSSRVEQTYGAGNAPLRITAMAARGEGGAVCVRALAFPADDFHYLGSEGGAVLAQLIHTPSDELSIHGLTQNQRLQDPALRAVSSQQGGGIIRRDL